MYISNFNNPLALVSTFILLFVGVTLSGHAVICGPDVVVFFQALLINPAFCKMAGSSTSISPSSLNTAVLVIETFWLVKITFPFLD